MQQHQILLRVIGVFMLIYAALVLGSCASPDQTAEPKVVLNIYNPIPVPVPLPVEVCNLPDQKDIL